ncbi:hypothetical protein CEUSTIGMA_g8710.t1 [Chlamydomonas eustigma]|uniref:Adenylate kinase isoenzyme 6 homolog n=1 Tax=Chlamydomonas eustigma TaxID=1157962 RepID=A0A250XDW9_9CHLO|nr:hypothetical protein CEUSTIGMA_g8710.t1 [Chlamydomonas eustigma]|eukprot:GAX81278.1 hypothetical protein CEUSTIGMA_g8710.t1 [Chlamydomonas eustigma]
MKFHTMPVIRSHEKRENSLINMSSRDKPNIMITGTPGTGKTSLCEQLARETGFRHINVGDWVKEKSLHSGWDDDFECFVLDDDKVCDALEELVEEGGCIVDHHGCDMFPERWFDLVIVLQTDNSTLFDRLQRRGYSQKKIQENVECEIMMVVAEEARESYKEEIVKLLPSNTSEDLERNLQQLVDWIRANT